MTLENELFNYVELTKRIIEALKKEEYDKLKDLTDNRQVIVNELQNINFTKEEFRIIYNKLSLKKYEDEMNNLLNDKHNKLKHNIENIKIQRKLSNCYIKQNTGPIIFSKKI